MPPGVEHHPLTLAANTRPTPAFPAPMPAGVEHKYVTGGELT
jgi:hypothetical protein